MKLVNIIPVILISIFINSIYSQNDYCGTNDNPSLNVANSNSSCNFFDHTNYSASINENYLNSFPQVSIDLVIWGYENLDGDKTISQEDANNILESLNNVYGEFNICFNLIHFNHIVSNLGYNGSMNLNNDFNNTQYDGLALQIFVPNDYDYRGLADFDDVKNIVRKDQISTGILHHEVGHNLGLLHPFGCERVTRDPTDPNYNADTDGDYVVDTKAAPTFYSNMVLVSDDCTSFNENLSNLTNCHNEQYTNLTESDLKNIMQWTFCPRVIFTTGQKIRMHESLQICSNNRFANIINDNAVELSSINSDVDYGIEPDNQTGVIWDSPDIWVRNQPDGLTVQEHEDLEYINNNSSVYVYVKIRNIGCNASSGNDNLKLYWAKGGIGQQTWPDVWTGANNSSESLDIGNEIGSQSIPVIENGGETILEFEWQPKNPDVYENAGFISKPWMFCFLSRIESSDDPMTFIETSNPSMNTRNNNNIVYKNTTTLNMSGNGLIGSILAGNLSLRRPITSDINFFTNHGNLIWEEAEIRVQLSEDLWGAWLDSGANSTDVKILNSSERIIYLSSNNSSLENIYFESNEWGILNPRINFLIKEVTDKTYTLNITQTLSNTEEVLGGFTYNINRNSSRKYFIASATLENNQDNTQLEAEGINENATYNWYDEEGNFISSGQTLTITNTNLKDYKLEVIADSDGHKDYKTFTVKEDRKFTNIYPNPITDNFTIDYKLGSAVSAFVTITNVISGVTDNLLLDLTSKSKLINISGKPSGQYIINLITDNIIVDTKQIIKN